MDTHQIKLTELKSINKRLDEQGKQLTEQGKQLIEQGKQINNLSQGQARINTALEALKEGQDSSTAAIRADIQDLSSKMAKNKKETDIRLNALDEYTGHHNPIKH